MVKKLAIKIVDKFKMPSNIVKFSSSRIMSGHLGVGNYTGELILVFEATRTGSPAAKVWLKINCRKPKEMRIRNLNITDLRYINDKSGKHLPR